MKNVLVICGGKSAEHEVSIRSARNIIAAIDKKHYHPIPVVISRSGSWYLLRHEAQLENITEFKDDLNTELCTLIKFPHQTMLITTTGEQIKVDVAFPLVHGPMGEDGTLQGLIELMDLPLVGSGVLASAIGMDKDFLKKTFAHAEVPFVPFITITKKAVPEYEEVCKKLESKILFVKPAVMGSSVGILKVTSKEQYHAAIEQAFCYGFKVLIEKYISGREVECSVLGNATPMASCVGEIKPHHDFYSYEAKYIDPNGADLIIPADIPTHLAEQIRELAIKAFNCVECKGFARVDFFISDDQKIYVNELNSIPGFTSISMYPKLWEASGIDYTSLISNLINLAFEEFEAKQKICLRPDELFYQVLTSPQKTCEPKYLSEGL